MTKYILIFLLVLPFFSFSQKYVQIEEEVVNIRFKPTTSSTIVGQGVLGQVFLRKGALNNWVEIQLPSGENRWIYRELISLVTDYGAILDGVSISSLQTALIDAKKRAENDSFTKNIESMDQKEIEDFLLDKYTK